MGLLEITAAIISAVLGWRNGQIGRREIKGIAIVVLGWTAVTTVASLPYVNLAGVLAVLVFRTVLIGAPFVLAALAKRFQRRRR